MRAKIMIGLLLIFVLIAGCSTDEANKSSRDFEKIGVAQEGAIIKEKFVFPSDPVYLYPLTGVQIDEPSTNRIVGVMINNHPAARPQSGLSQADLVFEILSEGQTTRFLAMFQSEQPAIVGPVRSARPYYFNLAKDYDALYIYHGAARFIEDMLRAGVVDNLNGSYFDNDRHLFKRESFRVAPHNSYLLFPNVEEVALKRGYNMEVEHAPLTFLSEDEFDQVTGNENLEVSFNYGSESVRYRYDHDSRTYHRFNGNQQTVELNNQTPIRLSNVFIIETAHQVVDKQGRREIDLASGGKAYLLQRGTLRKLQWENRDGYIVPVENGEQVPFIPGKTWINVIPTSPGLAGVREVE